MANKYIVMDLEDKETLTCAKCNEPITTGQKVCVLTICAYVPNGKELFQGDVSEITCRKCHATKGRK